MTQKQAQQQWESGHLVFPVTYVGSSAEVIRWRDSGSGKALEAPVLKHNVVFGNRVGVVNERVPETFSVANFTPPFAPMSKCLMTVDAMEVSKGVPSFRGKLEALTA